MKGTPPEDKRSVFDEQFAREMCGRWVGPFPISSFLDLLPDTGAVHAAQPGFFNDIPREDKKVDMYPFLIQALDSLELEQLQFVNTSNNLDGTAPDYEKWKPDISTYTFGFKPKARVQRDPTYPVAPEKKSLRHISELILPFVLRQGNHDPFCDMPSGSDAHFESPSHQATQGRIASILSEMLSYSFRTHAFLVFMDGCIARIVRADRAGVLVSEAFDYRMQQYLTQFLHRFNNATPSQRGIDGTVSRNHKFIQFTVPHHPNPIKSDLERCLPHTESLAGRGRRVIKVYDEYTNQHIFMKDGWRADSPRMIPEWVVLDELNQKHVPNVSKVLSGGDIQTEPEFHRTLADQYTSSVWRVGPKTSLTPRVHYRFIEECAGEPLEKILHAKQLTQVLADVVEALQGAWIHCRYLHRDVSSSNIMITPAGRGVLIDWEFVKEVPLKANSARVTDRAGTWIYMSSALLRFPEKQPSVFDDLQSVYWVALVNGLDYLPHTYPKMEAAADCLVEYDPRTKLGGRLKSLHLYERNFIEFVGNSAFSRLLYNLCGIMCLTNAWEVDLAENLDPAREGHESCQLPDHGNILEEFHRALSRPDNDWTIIHNQVPQFQEFMKKAQLKVPNTTSPNSHSTISQPPLLSFTGY